MFIVFLTAIVVGGATMLGSLLGFLCKTMPQRFSNVILAFAAGVMLSASIVSLIIPSISHGGYYAVFTTTAGIFAGAACVGMIDYIVPCLHQIFRHYISESRNADYLNKIILFTAAIAMHNLLEGLAAGITFGTGNVSEALLIAGGIALQNIPEGMITVLPLLTAGLKPNASLICGCFTGVIEIIGTLIGYYAVMAVSSILPFSLAFAGGTMLYVICDEMIPETCDHNNGHLTTYALLAGFSLMLFSDLLLG